MRTDREIQEDVLAELRWDPSLANDDIAVSVRDGVVTLAGFADSWADRWKAERVASRVRGVKAVANDIKVRLPSSSERPDPELARAAVDALKWNVLVPDDRIRVKVANGWLTLEGEVDWYYQKEEAERAVRKLRGVKGVTNLVTVAVRPASSDVKEKIRDALERGAELDADRIRVEVEGNRVILRGTVRSYTEKRDAERAARNAPGVTEVENLIIVDPLIPAAV
ncbi:MAG TPA: BON domain-containing protein [Longimicrobium sp.]